MLAAASKALVRHVVSVDRIHGDLISGFYLNMPRRGFPINANDFIVNERGEWLSIIEI
jgi:hypothetical protein